MKETDWREVEELMKSGGFNRSKWKYSIEVGGFTKSERILEKCKDSRKKNDSRR